MSSGSRTSFTHSNRRCSRPDRQPAPGRRLGFGGPNFTVEKQGNHATPGVRAPESLGPDDRGREKLGAKALDDLFGCGLDHLFEKPVAVAIDGKRQRRRASEQIDLHLPLDTRIDADARERIKTSASRRARQAHR